jgi:hypothetical protein
MSGKWIFKISGAQKKYSLITAKNSAGLVVA